MTKSNLARIAVAFASFGGVYAIKDSALNLLSNGGKIELLVGLDFAITDPKAIRNLFEWTKGYPDFMFFVLPPSGAAIYHPKMYLLDSPMCETIIVGSSNLTEAGLYKNAEANIFVKGFSNSNVYVEAVESFLRLKFDRRYVPDEEFINAYEEASSRIARQRGAKDNELRKISESISEQVSKLQKPKFSRDDLVGWAKLVYEFLPEGDFTNEDVYKHELFFQEKYPENRHVREKIRQQLQFLEASGVLTHISRGIWRKNRLG